MKQRFGGQAIRAGRIASLLLCGSLITGLSAVASGCAVGAGYGAPGGGGGTSVAGSGAGSGGGAAGGAGAGSDTSAGQGAAPSFTAKRQVDDTCDWGDSTLTGIRVGRHDGFDRVVFDLSGQAEPCYQVQLDPNPVQDGSGLPVDLGGSQAIRVEIPRLGPEFPTLAGGYTVPLDGQIVEFARFDTFFEGTSTSFIAIPAGVDAEFAVSTYPGKLVVDVKPAN